MLARLGQIDDRNVVSVLRDAVRICSLGQITQALFEVGGQYQRSVQAARRRVESTHLDALRSHHP